MRTDISVVGMASVYAGATDLTAYWEAILARRVGFRDFPDCRLPLADYGSDDRADRDRTNVRRAALIDGVDFDWQGNRVPRAAFEATDPVHWLALQSAREALADAGADLDALGRERVGVVLGNSLTGEVSRANLLRLRWPYVRRSLAEAAARTGLDQAATAVLLAEAEQSFKASFPVPNEDTLAGALSNVIAGRICNVLDLGGGGFVVDGACASSLLAAASACEALAAGRLDMAIAGGVDVSLDPLEMVGFARTGALTTGTMRVYDKASAGFLPGEGCGMLVLMRTADAERLGLTPWARIAGWGISSDGAGGITAPKASGQALAMRRCYELSPFGPDQLDFLEGHGTGTVVGDRQELAGMLSVTAPADAASEDAASGPVGELRRTGVTSVKTIVGHTKAAAGAAGLIKAVLAVNQRVLPPMAGLADPNEAFATPGARLYPIRRGAALPADRPLRAGVSGAGFGGINCHVAVCSEGVPRRPLSTVSAERLLASAQAAEVVVAGGDDVAGLRARLQALLARSKGMAEGELADFAAEAAERDAAGPLRAAVVAADPMQLQARLRALLELLAGGWSEAAPVPTPPATHLGRAHERPRIGLLLPGQGSQMLGMGGRLAQRTGWGATRRRRWDAALGQLPEGALSAYIDRPLERADGPGVIARWDDALRDTRVAQPAIVMTSLQWLQWLRGIGLTPAAVAGHSLGEITALVAAGVLAEAEAIELVRLRAEACAAADVPAGGMLALRCGMPQAEALIAQAGADAVVANDNAPDQVVVAGVPEALQAIGAAADAAGVRSRALRVSRAFHTGHMEAAAGQLAALAAVRGEARQAAIAVFSAVAGGRAPDSIDPYDYAARQITAPVRFREAVGALAGHCDLLLELGPGQALTGLARSTLAGTPGGRVAICALEPAADDDQALCTALARLYVAGAPIDWSAVYADRHVRPFVPAAERQFIVNPCERRPAPGAMPRAAAAVADQALASAAPLAPAPMVVPQSSAPAETPSPTPPAEAGADDDIETLLRELVARESGYDLDTIDPGARLAADLNLDSIKIAELRAELVARGIELPEDQALGTMPIRALAQAAVRTGGGAAAASGSAAVPAAMPATGTGQPDLPGRAAPWPGAARPPGAGAAAPAGPAAGGAVPLPVQAALEAPLPADLPVVGCRRVWTPASLAPAEPPVAHVLILPAAERLGEARQLEKTLRVLGVNVVLAPAEGAPATGRQRIVVLPGAREDGGAVARLLAEAGRRIARNANAVVLAARPGQAPVLGFAQSLWLERQALPVLAVELPDCARDASCGEALPPDAAPLARAVLARIDPGVTLLRLTGGGDADDAWRQPLLETWTPGDAGPAADARPDSAAGQGGHGIPLGTDEIVVVSGGGKGITAACTIALLRATGARAILLGTSPEEAPGTEVADTLARITATGGSAVYCRCDVTDAADLREAVARGAARLGGGAISGVIHGAGINTPALGGALDGDLLAREYAVKVGGLRNLLDAVDPGALRLCVAFGSVIGAVGMPGNAGYALANEAMAAVCRDLKRERPRLQVACPAFGVWRDVGMGAKLDVLATLARQGVAAIPVAAGVEWFLTCCRVPDLPIPLVVTAPMQGLPTWRRARGTEADPQARLLTARVVHEPGVVIVARPALHPARDTWLADHAFRGAMLFATVQALAGIGSGAALLAGGGRVRAFRGLVIDHPIVCARDRDTRVELDIRRLPEPDQTPAGAADTGPEPALFHGCVGLPGQARGAPAFAVACLLDAAAPGAEPAPPEAPADGGAWQQVPAEVGRHLYDALLFQRGAFQRIESVLALDLSDPVCRRGRCEVRREAADPDAATPDPFFLDGMLQSVQLLVPRDVCLPTGIDAVVLHPGAWRGGIARVEAAITERTANGYVTRVTAVDAADGAPVARFDGYRVSIVEHHAERPDVETLLDPLATDRAAMARWSAGQPSLQGLDLALGAVDECDPETRRDTAARQVAAQLGVDAASAVADAGGVLSWDEGGAPHLLPDSLDEADGAAARGVSISHDGGRLLTALGVGRVGCDLQRVSCIDRPWREVLPQARLGLWQALTEALGDPDGAGALTWAVDEALIKAGARGAAVEADGLDGAAPRLRLADGGSVVAGLLELVLAGRAAIAVARLPRAAGTPPRLPEPAPAMAVGGTARTTHFSRDLVMSFKEALPPLRSPTAPVFFGWMGELREAAMADIRAELAHAFSVGGKGMVTNGTRVHLTAPVPFDTRLRAWVWLERVLHAHPSTFELGFQWAALDERDQPRRIVAEGSQRLTWVAVGRDGHVDVEPFPAFFADFIDARRPVLETAPFRPPLGLYEDADGGGALLWPRGGDTGTGPGETRLELATDAAHSNFVGNVYFSHIATFAERACRAALGVEDAAGLAAGGGFFAGALELDHLGEAMPGDLLEARARLTEVRETRCCLAFTVVNQSRGGLRIAAGRARYRRYAGAGLDAPPLALGEQLAPAGMLTPDA